MSKKNSNTSLQTLAKNFCTSRSERDFSRLYERMRPGVFVYLKQFLTNNDDIEDAVSLTFAKAWTKIDQFDPYYQFSTWVYTIAKNEALQIIRSKNKRNETSFEGLVEAGAPVDKYAGFLDIQENEGCVDRKFDIAVSEIKKIGADYTTALTKRDIEGKKYKDIAEELGWCINTVKTRVRKGRNMIKSCLEKNYADIFINN